MTDQAKALVLTLISSGGVAAMTAKVVECLRAGGFEAELAYYMPHKMASELSVPAWRLLDRTPKSRQVTAPFGVTAYEIGVRLPEFEWARYMPSRQWRDVIGRYDHHIAVSGSILPALPPLLCGKPCLAWIATPYFADRAERRKSFPWPRRLIDTAIDTPVCRRLEKWALARARILALSRYTAAALARLRPGVSITQMPMPIETDIYFPPQRDRIPVRHIGFAGRYDDPRKNVKLLIETLSLCRARGLDLTLHLIGAKASPELQTFAAGVDVSRHIKFHESVGREQMPQFYHSLDIFVIPSYQEGLSIAGLEAMACGCPVVSTRCGGPEEYVIEGETGLLVDFDAPAMAEAISRIAGNRELYRKMSAAAVSTVGNNYSDEAFENVFWAAFEQTHGSRQKAHV